MHGLHASATPAAGTATRQSALPRPPYFGQPVPGLTPEKFAPGVVSTGGHRAQRRVHARRPRVLFTRLVDTIDTMFHSRYADGVWSAPGPLMVYAGQAKAVAVDMAVSSGRHRALLSRTACARLRAGSLQLGPLGQPAGEWSVDRGARAAAAHHDGRTRVLPVGGGRRQPVFRLRSAGRAGSGRRRVSRPAAGRRSVRRPGEPRPADQHGGRRRRYLRRPGRERPAGRLEPARRVRPGHCQG